MMPYVSYESLAVTFSPKYPQIYGLISIGIKQHLKSATTFASVNIRRLPSSVSMPTKSYFADTALAVKNRAISLHIKSPLGASKIN